MTHIEAMKQALENLDEYYITTPEGQKLVADLRKAIAEAEQEPVAWRVSYPNDPELGFWFAEGIGGEGCLNEPLYTHPQPKREPLTDEQIDAYFAEQWIGYSGYHDCFKEVIRWAEAAHGIKE